MFEDAETRDLELLPTSTRAPPPYMYMIDKQNNKNCSATSILHFIFLNRSTRMEENEKCRMTYQKIEKTAV